MNLKKRTVILAMMILLLLPTVLNMAIAERIVRQNNISHDKNIVHLSRCFTDVTSTFAPSLPSAITVSDSNPFFPLIATPLAVRYDPMGVQEVIPLYIKNFTNPSKAVIRAEQQIGISSDYLISDLFTSKEISLLLAETFWEESSAALIIEENQNGYELGVVATPLASYLGIPVIVTDEIDNDVQTVLHELNVETLYICGDLSTEDYTTYTFTDVDEIVTETIAVLSDRFGVSVEYITIANPLDVTSPATIEKETHFFSGTITSGIVLPTQLPYLLLKGGAMAVHEFVIPSHFKYAHVSFDLINTQAQHVEELGDRIFLMVYSPTDECYVYAGTCGGLPKRNHNGDIVEDKVHFETTIYDKPGTYQIQLYGQWFASKTGSYELTVTVERLNSPFVPLMDKLSSIAPYLTAYHKGIVFAKPEFAFAADDDVLYNGSTCPGVSQPGTNPQLIVPSNQHTMMIHDQLNELLAQIANIPDDNLQQLQEHYKHNPVYIAIVADPTMVPMYYYYNPDGEPDNIMAYLMGFALPSDFIYGDIDPNPSDMENDTFSYWPLMENIVGRVTGRDIQDCSALIARTIFYNNILEKMETWKNNALVQTGCGLEFQNLPFITRLSHLLYSGRGEPTKFPTGESTFINLRLKETMATGYSTAKSTFLLQSQRAGLSKSDLQLIKTAGLLNRLLFPSKFLHFLDADTKVTGEWDHLNSNLIFTFAHGSYNLFEHGDVFIDSRGFPFITPLTRIYPRVRSGLSAKGSYDIRSVENMEYGPSVIFVESCITGRTDGFQGENVLSQTFLHAGVNTYIGATRVTADPGYLEPRPLPGGWGLGTLGLLKTLFNYLVKKEYPDVHFGAVIAEDFIKDLIDNDSTVGLALRNAKNMYLKKDANSTFLWTPPLTLSTGCSFIDLSYLSSLSPEFSQNSRTRVLGKKYVALHEFTLYGDPMFNPYQTVNNG